jgi:hypothetical protein
MSDQTNPKESYTFWDNVDKVVTNKKPPMIKSPSYTLSQSGRPSITMIPTPIVSASSSKRSFSFGSSPPSSPTSKEKREQGSASSGKNQNQTTSETNPQSPTSSSVPQTPPSVPLPPPILPPTSKDLKKESAEKILLNLPPPPPPISEIQSSNKSLTSSAPNISAKKNSPAKR